MKEREAIVDVNNIQKKTSKNFWTIMGSTYHVAQMQPIEIGVKIVKTVILPRLCSGLHSLTMTEKQLKSIDVYFHEIVRCLVGFRRNSSIHAVVDILGIERPSTFIMNACLMLRSCCVQSIRFRMRHHSMGDKVSG